jgi:hypothetical protein
MEILKQGEKMQKERKAGENFDDYKDRLRKEKKKLRLYCKGVVCWDFSNPYIFKYRTQRLRY